MRSYPGEHEAIVDEFLWSQVQKRVASNRITQVTRSGATSPSLISGLVYDDGGQRLTPTQTKKRGVSYRYYVTNGLIIDKPSRQPNGVRIPAGELEAVVERQVQNLLSDE